MIAGNKSSEVIFPDIPELSKGTIRDFAEL
jgi:hypothetical protein